MIGRPGPLRQTLGVSAVAQTPEAPDRLAEPLGVRARYKQGSMGIDDTQRTEQTGLSQEEARRRLQADGPNDIEPARRRGVARRIVGLLAEPMFALLLAAVLIYLALGDLGEGITLAVFVLAVLGLTLLQEGRADRSIEALRRLSEHRVQVLRDGVSVERPAREVVRGDLILLSEGQRIAADGSLLQSDNLQVDESLLTGESVPVSKLSGLASPLGGDPIFAGTHVIRGQGLMRVKSTGARTQVGQIGQSLHALPQQPTPLQRQTQRLVRILALIALILCALMVAIEGQRSGQWLAALLVGIAVAMAMLPEEYPVVLAIFPALGARRLARHGVLTRRIAAIETLGATTVLCADKTGTITQNRMAVQALAVGEGDKLQLLRCRADGLWPSGVTPAFHRIAEHAILASAPQPFDPMEQAFHQMGRDLLQGTGRLHQWDLVQTYPLSPQLRAMSHVWRVSEGAGHVISAKGAPEAMMDLCHLSATQRAQWQTVVEQMAGEGLRVLAVARGHHPDSRWPETAHGFDFEWIGLIGLADPLRPQVPQAMAQCRRAGIRVIMITGDHPSTAQVIAAQAGLPVGRLLTGDEVQALSDPALDQRLRQTTVCARIAPQQKLRIVQALVRTGEIVTMTGDGVNDAPALRAAHVGVAMGGRGTDVAREAASMVLVDDDFASIVRGIRVGRRIFGNLRKSMGYIFAIHIPIAGMAMLPVLLALPPILLPLHIALIELVVDPACSLAFENEPEEPDLMDRPPRDTRAPLFGARDMLQAAGQGLLLLGGTALAYLASRDFGSESAQVSTERTRSMVLLAFVAGNALLILLSKAGTFTPRRPHAAASDINWVAWALAGVSLAAVGLALYQPLLAAALQLRPLGALDAVWALACGASGLLAAFGVRRLLAALAR